MENLQIWNLFGSNLGPGVVDGVDGGSPMVTVRRRHGGRSLGLVFGGEKRLRQSSNVEGMRWMCRQVTRASRRIRLSLRISQKTKKKEQQSDAAGIKQVTSGVSITSPGKRTAALDADTWSTLLHLIYISNLYFFFLAYFFFCWGRGVGWHHWTHTPSATVEDYDLLT